MKALKDRTPALRRDHRWMRRVSVPVLWLVLAAASLTSARAQQAVDESHLKGAFLYKFAQFVEWPAEATAAADSLQICIAGPRPSRAFLEELVAGETIAGRPLTVHPATSATADRCHVLFLGDDASRRLLLRRVADRPVLTVSDAPSFLDEGGVVQLRLIDNRVRFEIDADAARRANLRLNTQLLRLALTVRGGATR